MKSEPDFRKKEAFKIIGIERYTASGIPAIREAWAEFSKRNKEIPNAILPNAFGIEDYSRDFDRNTGRFPKFYYIAGYEVTDLSTVPAGMVGKEIAAANYAVFNFNEAMDNIHAFFGFIYVVWLPNSGFSMDPKLSLDFEYYSEPNMDMNNVQLEI